MIITIDDTAGPSTFQKCFCPFCGSARDDGDDVVVIMCENVRCDDRGCVHLKGGSKDRRAGRAPNVGRVSCWRSLVQTIPNSEAVSWGY